MDYEHAGDILWIPLSDIFVDTDFNCRGYFNPREVHDLGQDIKTNGQLVPLIIQPIEDVPDDERLESCVRPFRLLAGHRRYMALDYWTDETRAKCCVEKGLTPQQARTLNFTENLKRKDLNILQEAQALVVAWPGGAIKDISREIGESKRWVAVRQNLLELPDYVQRKAASGQISQFDIEGLAQLDPCQIESAFQEIVLAQRRRPNRLPTLRGGPRREQPRGKQEISKLIEFLFANSRFSRLGEDERDFVVSTLAWVQKGIDSKEFLENRLGFPEGCVIVDEKDKVLGLGDD